MSTTIDVSGVLFAARKNAIEEFEKKVKEGNQAGARMKASEIAGICRQLAKSSPYSREQNIQSAKKWEELAHSVELTPQKKSVVSHGKVDNRAVENDDYVRQIESLLTKSTVKWSDIGGMEQAKHLLMETVVLAGISKPKSMESFKPWKGVMMFGPPGTGKTLLAAAAAGNLAASFFDVKASSLLSKYFGESARLVTALYNSARGHSPSIIFVDEFDSLTTSRNNTTGSSESSKLILSTLLAELDGLKNKCSKDFILTLAATNSPWSLDEAILSRFPQRIYVPLPDVKSTEAILKIHTKGVDTSHVNLKSISGKCVDMLYSGRDLSSFCQYAIMNMIQRENPSLHTLAELPFNELSQKTLKTCPLSNDDFKEGLKRIKSPITRDTLERYEAWDSMYGGGIKKSPVSM